MTLNPNTPTRRGMEWLPRYQRGLRVSRDQSVAVDFTPDVARTVSAMHLRCAKTAGTPVLQVDVMAYADLVPPSPPVAQVFRPTGDATMTGNMTIDGANWSRIDEAVLDTSDAVFGGGVSYDPEVATFHFGTGAFADRALGVRFTWVSSNALGVAQVVTPILEIGGVTYDYPDVTNIEAAGVGNVTIVAEWALNPSTNAPWTRNQIRDFAVGGASAAGIRTEDPAGTSGEMNLYQGEMEVYAIAETRLASGYATAVDGTVTVTTLTPVGGSFTWTGRCYAVISVPGGGGSCSIVALDSGTAHPNVASARVAFDTNGVPSGVATDTAAPAFTLLNGSSVVLDGQPYSSINPVEVYSGRVVQQEVTLTNTDNRGYIEFVACLASTLTTSTLTVKLKKRSDGSQIGGDYTITPFDVRDAPRLMHHLVIPAASAGAGVNAQCYLEFSCPAAAGKGWLVNTVVTAEATASLTKLSGTFEGGVSGWTVTSANGTITQDATGARTGSFGAKVQAGVGAAADLVAITTVGTGGFVVTAGRSYPVSGWVKQGTGGAKTNTLAVVWYDSTGAVLSTSTVGSVVSSGSFQQITATVVAPALAAYGALRWTVTGLSTFGHNQYGDDFSVTEIDAADKSTIDATETELVVIPVVVGKAIVAPDSQAVAAA